MSKKQSLRSNVRALVPQSSNDPFKTVCGMEDDVKAIEDLSIAVALIAESIDDEGVSSAVQRLAWEIKHYAEAVEADPGKLFHALHPNRAHFERVGWPDERPATVSTEESQAVQS